jgi:hypothetical protein
LRLPPAVEAHFGNRLAGSVKVQGAFAYRQAEVWWFFFFKRPQLLSDRITRRTPVMKQITEPAILV